MHGCSECTERDHIWSGMGIVPCLGPCVLRDSPAFRSRAPDAALSFVGPSTVGTRTQETGACRPAPPTSHTTPTTTSRPGYNMVAIVSMIHLPSTTNTFIDYIKFQRPHLNLNVPLCPAPSMRHAVTRALVASHAARQHKSHSHLKSPASSA